MSLLVTFTSQAMRKDTQDDSVAVNTARILTVTPDSDGGSVITIDAGENASILDKRIRVAESPDTVRERINQAAWGGNTQTPQPIGKINAPSFNPMD